MKEIGTMARGIIAAGFDGLHADPSLPRFGAYVLFARNVASLLQVRALTDALRARDGDGVGPLIAVDQEGGRVARLRDGVETMPSMMALGAAGDLELAQRAGEQIAFDLRRAGCTLDFAPVLDLALFAENTVIGTRSFGADPQRVAALGSAFAAGLQRGGVAACCKHFPGHGATREDSHAVLPWIDADAATLRARDLAPFAAVAPQCAAVMGTHSAVRAFDDRPATLSPRVVTGLLRDELRFDGAYVTDCLQMSALAAWGSPAAAAVAALAAGADLLTVSHGVALANEIVERIERAIGDGTLPLERLRQAYVRVLRLRRAALPPVALDAPAPHPGIGREIGRRAITLLRGDARIDPTTATAISFEGAVADGIETTPAPAAGLQREAPALHELRAPLDPGDGETRALLNALAEGRRRPLLLARRAHVHSGQARAIARIVEAYPDAVVASLLEPWDVARFTSARHVVAAYGDDAASLGGLADVLFGGSLPEGRLPVELPA